jgi:hypoxanthine phosphoribosyltransferase
MTEHGEASASVTTLSPDSGIESDAGQGTRIFEHARIWQLDREGFEAAARMLAAAEPAPALVVGIARGGVELARFLSDWFGVPFATVTARHNVGDGPYAEMARVVEIEGAVPAAASGILIADDICGTGDTLTAVVSHVTGQLGHVAVRTVALCRNSGAAFAPDAWVWNVADWVAFPWEEPPSGRTELLTVPERLCLKEDL